MSLPHSSFRIIVHNQEWQTVLYVEVEHTYDVRMLQCGNCLRFLSKIFDLFSGEMGVEHFDSSFCSETCMLSQIDLGETSLSQQTDQAIVAQLYACKVALHRIPFPFVEVILYLS